MTVTQQSPWLAAAGGPSAPCVPEVSTGPDARTAPEEQTATSRRGGKHASRPSVSAAEPASSDTAFPLAGRDPLTDPYAPYHSQTGPVPVDDPAVGRGPAPSEPASATPVLSPLPGPAGSASGSAPSSAPGSRSVPVLASWSVPVSATVTPTAPVNDPVAAPATSTLAARHASLTWDPLDRRQPVELAHATSADATPIARAALAAGPASSTGTRKASRSVAQIMAEIEAQVEVEMAVADVTPPVVDSVASVPDPVAYQPRRRAAAPVSEEPTASVASPSTGSAPDDELLDEMWPDLNPVRRTSDWRQTRIGTGSLAFEDHLDEALDRAFPTDRVEVPLAGAPCGLYDDLSLPPAARAGRRPGRRAAGRRVERRHPASVADPVAATDRPDQQLAEPRAAHAVEPERAREQAIDDRAVLAPVERRRTLSPVLFGLLGLVLGLVVSGALLGAAWMFLFPPA